MARKNAAAPLVIGGLALGALVLIAGRPRKARASATGPKFDPEPSPGPGAGPGPRTPKRPMRPGSGNGNGNGGLPTIPGVIPGGGGNGNGNGNGLPTIPGVIPGGGGNGGGTPPRKPIDPPGPEMPPLVPPIIRPEPPPLVPPDLPGPTPTGPVDIIEIVPGPEDYPNFPPAVDPGNWPTPGMFHMVGATTPPGVSAMYAGTYTDYAGHSISYQALLVAAYFAEQLGMLPQGVTPADIAGNAQLRRAMSQLINCSPFNDMLYSQANSTVADNWLKGINGRSGTFRPVMGPTRELIEAGQSPVRTISVATGTRLQNPGVPANRYPFLWIPAINLEALVQGEISTQGMDYQDGSNRINPHPEIMDLFNPQVDNIPPSLAWGCNI